MRLGEAHFLLKSLLILTYLLVSAYISIEDKASDLKYLDYVLFLLMIIPFLRAQNIWTIFGAVSLLQFIILLAISAFKREPELTSMPAVYLILYSIYFLLPHLLVGKIVSARPAPR